MATPTKRVEISVGTNKFKDMTTWHVTVELTGEESPGDIVLEEQALALSDKLVADLSQRYDASA